MKIIGLTLHYTGNHDNSAALVIDGKVVFAESEERVTRIKHDTHFPVQSIKHALRFANIPLSKINYFASGSPQTNTPKLLKSYLLGFKYAGLRKFMQWLLVRIFLLFKGADAKESKPPNSLCEFGIPEDKVVYVSHYLAHAETAYHFSGIDSTLIVAWDGYGLDEQGKPLCGQVYKGVNGKLEFLEEIPVYTSLALYYGAVTVALGFKLNDGEGKTMGLAAYGEKSGAVQKICNLFPYFDGRRWVARNNWLEVNGVSRPDYFRYTPTYRYLRWLVEEYGAEQVAYAAQQVLEEEGENYFRYLVGKYGLHRATCAGGIFLNVKFNMRLLKRKIVDELFIYPNPGDGGIAVGAAIAAAKKFGEKIEMQEMQNTALGCEFSASEIREAIKSFGKRISAKHLGSRIHKVVAQEIKKGQVIGWFQGRGEWGPRALGQRSVLADPRSVNTKERINSKLKQRDWFMPFAPAILSEHTVKFLVHGYGTPFMTLTDDVKPNQAKKIPAAVHIDNTARAQIVYKKANPGYWKVIDEFYQLTRVPVLLNTSFNKHGLPIVHSPKEAIEHLLWGCIDELVIGPYLVTKRK